VRIRFDAFTLDSDTRQLIGRDGEVRLTPKAFDLLVLLVRERPRVVAKKDLFARIWPGTHVVEANLNGLIGELRRALGDHPKEPVFIRTVHGTGFAFAAEAVDLASPSSGSAPLLRYWLMWNERRFVLADGLTRVGRDPRCEIWLDASRVSREHARIVVDTVRELVTVEDAGSTNGTFVGKTPVTTATPLADGDVIEIGSVELTFRTWKADTQAETERVAREGK
jgi:DNA-binding winged helix-turn-helix (wHTH) protein